VPTPRRRRALGLAACAAALVLATCAAAPAPAGAALPHSFWGVVPINNLSSSELDLMGAGEVGTLRQLVIWPSVERKRGSYDWSYLDFLVANAARNGIEVLPFVYGTPEWVKQDCHGLGHDLCERVPPLGSKQARAAWSGFLTALANRYGTDGSFWPGAAQFGVPYVPITHWQIWNEPSSQTYYRPNPQPHGYASLVKLSDRALRAADPEAEVVLAGIFPEPEGGDRFRIGPYLHSFYRSKGIVRHFDIAALHPYARTLNGLRRQIKNVRRQMRRGGAGSKRLWITEVGWGSDPPVANRPLIKGIDGQREMLERSFKLLAARAGAWKLEGVLWYSWRDPGIGYENCPFCSSAGLLKENGDPKPAWHSFVDFTGGSASPPE
jgi:hypothetical protein